MGPCSSSGRGWIFRVDRDSIASYKQGKSKVCGSFAGWLSLLWGTDCRGQELARKDGLGGPMWLLGTVGLN